MTDYDFTGDDGNGVEIDATPEYGLYICVSDNDVAASADGDARRVRLRLADFTVDNDLDLSRIAAVRFDFGGELGSAHGRLALDDLELVPR